MEQDKRELLDTYRKLEPENKANILAHVRVALAAQENTRKAMSTPEKAAPAPGKGRKTA
jgi:hypothetical protein